MHALESDHPDPAGADDPRLASFEALYRGQFAFVWAVARHLGVPPGALEDVVQDVFVAAYRRFEQLRWEVSPRAWLYGVTRHVSARYRRGVARRVRRHLAFAEQTRAHADAPQQRHDDAQQLERLLAGLSDTTRTVWQMTELLGMSAPEIASELGVPLNTVYSRLRLARAQLQALVTDEAALERLRDPARDRPPAGARQRAWALLLPGLGETGGGAGLLVWVKTQAGMATTLLATGAVVVGLSFRPGTQISPPPAATPQPASAPALTAARSTAAAPQMLAVSPAPPLPVVERRLSSRTAAPASDAQARLAEELALIDRARAQLTADDAAAVLVTLAAHAQRFPAGALADVREAVRVEATCRRGDVAGAEATARRLLAEHPSSAVAQSFKNFVCPR
jgi:RNA polymerase sigma factor (sigma-70 family)